MKTLSMTAIRKLAMPFACFAVSTFPLSMSAQTVAPHTTPYVVPQSYATATSSETAQGQSWITVIDVSGDTLVRAQPLAFGSSLGLTLDSSGLFGQSIQGPDSVDYFANGTNLVSGAVGNEIPPSNTCVSNLYMPAQQQLYALDYKSSRVQIGYPSGSNGAFILSDGDTVGTTPVGMTGDPGTNRYFVISQNVPYGVACNNIPHQVSAAGQATIFDATFGSTEGTIPLGRCPVFGLTSPDGQRSFILNRGDDSISVLNVPQAGLDQSHPTILLPQVSGSHAGPVHAEYVARSGKLLIANYESDTVSVVNVQLDSDGLDGPAFGTIVASIDLWNGNTNHPGQYKHPTTIAALPDGSRAYVTNQSDETVSVIDLKLNEVVSSLPLANNTHPRSIAVVSNAETNALFAKLYISAPDGNAIPWVYAVDNVIANPSCPNTSGVCSYAGNVTDVRASAQDYSSSTNKVTWSRTAGAGSPCELDKATPDNLLDCQAH